jgi:hypothetical protein
MRADPTSKHATRRLCLLLSLVFMLMLLSACTRSGSSGKPIDATTAALAGTPGATPGALRLVTPGMPVLDIAPERPLYTMNVTLDYAGNNVHAQEKVEFQNPTGAPTSEIKFNVALNHRPGVIEVRDARIFGQSEPLTFVLSNTVLTVKLPGSLGPDDGIALSFDFVIQIPVQEAINGIGGDDSSHGTGSLTGGHWYIMLAPYYDGGWDTPAYVPIGDPYAEGLADYEVSFLAPENIVIAGAGDEQHEGRLWRFSLQKARVFAFSASDSYKVDTLKQDGITYIAYSYPQHQKFADAVLNTAARAVALYAQLYGPYPYKALRIVETGRAQGQEYSGLVGIGTLLYAGYPGHGSRHDLISTTAHEVAHQWWFQQVGNRQVRTPWLDESFARLSEMRFYQKYYPNDADWWYRFYIVGARAPRGSLDIDLPITAYADAHTYIEAVYRRGLMFLRDVRGKVGASYFDAAMQDYYNAELYKVTTPDAFFDALARHTSVDISPLVKSYFASTVALPCSISNDAAGCRH